MTSLSARLGRVLCMIFLIGVSLVGRAGQLFEENFDDQPDFTSTMHSTNSGQETWNGYTLPTGWDAMYQNTQWSPETGYPNNHASLEILGSNSDKARGGTGKSAVMWRESYAKYSSSFASDSQLIHLLGQEYNEVYVEFWISFSENWWQRTNVGSWQSKIFRAGSWDGVGNIYNGALDAIGPVFFWDYKRDNYGMRNNQAFRGGPWGENYYLDLDALNIKDNTNYGSDTVGMSPGGTDPKVINQVNGGYLADMGRYDFISHEQLFGPVGHWTKVAFYLKMNSSPGTADGIMMQWINDQRIKVQDNIPWVGKNTENKMVGWNYIAIGGNDYFQPYPNDQRFEDWYSIDDIVVRTDMPLYLKDANVAPTAPNPPSGLSVEIK